MRIARCVRQHRIGPIALFIDRRPPVAHRARDAREPVTTDRATRTERRAARSVRVRRRQRRFGALLGVVSLACGGALLASAAEPSEALAASWSTGVEASLPAGAGSSPDVEITSVSCASAGECSAVGNYTDGSDHQQGLLLSESGGTWSAGVEATLPAGAGSEPGVASVLGVVRLRGQLQRRRLLHRQLGKSTGAALERERGHLVDGGQGDAAGATPDRTPT